MGFNIIKRRAKSLLLKVIGRTPWARRPDDAYNLWSETYDSQSDNLMIELDNVIFPELLNDVSLEGKVVADVGCGTGRHWPALISHRPSRLIGFDVSSGMLDQLRQKYPEAEVQLISGHKLDRTDDGSIDVIVCTLTLIYFTSLKDTFHEWNRVLRPGGKVIFTTNHPEALQRGSSITFKHGSQTIAIRHNLYSLSTIEKQAGSLRWQMLKYVERNVDETVKHFYEKHNALHVYEAMKNTPIIYGVCLQKNS